MASMMTGATGTKPVIDWKGVLSFLGITFVITYAIEGTLIVIGISPLVKGLGQYIVAAVMWVPAIATVLTVKLVTRESFKIANIRFGDWRPYVASGLIIPGCFLIIYALTWLLGFGHPDWSFRYFMSTFVAAGKGVPPMPPVGIVWTALFFSTLILAPFLNGLFGFGEELGWRGYLLPKLLSLGKVRAYLILGIVWGLWHLPLILVGFMYPGYPLLGVLLFICLTTIFGIYLNEMTLKYKSSILAGWIHGVFNSQRLGIWVVLFPKVNPLVGGYAGIIGFAVWLVLGTWIIRRDNAAKV